jgi:Domain of unknown function (DUF397)
MENQAAWRKSSYSYPGNCVEAASFRKSSHSNSQGACVEAGHGTGIVGIRDSQLGEASLVLEISLPAWAAFTKGLQA